MAYAFNDDKSKIAVYNTDEVYNKDEIDELMDVTNEHTELVIPLAWTQGTGVSWKVEQVYVVPYDAYLFVNTSAVDTGSIDCYLNNNNRVILDNTSYSNNNTIMVYVRKGTELHITALVPSSTYKKNIFSLIKI